MLLPRPFKPICRATFQPFSRTPLSPDAEHEAERLFDQGGRTYVKIQRFIQRGGIGYAEMPPELRTQTEQVTFGTSIRAYLYSRGRTCLPSNTAGPSSFNETPRPAPTKYSPNPYVPYLTLPHPTALRRRETS